jgi:pullulanase
MPFLWCGEEIARDKKGVHNSYCSPDDINAIDWSLKAENLDLFAYYQGLITMRKAHPAFHMGDADWVRENVHCLDAPAGVVAYQLNGEAVGDEWKTIIVILNSQLSTINYQLPEGEYHVAVADGKCPAAAQGLLKGSAKIAAQSAMVLYL